MATGSSLDRLARAIKQSGTAGSSPAWLPRTPQMTMHQGVLTDVDIANGHVDFQFPDQGIVVPSVRMWQAYSADHVPQVGHVAWGIHYGTDFVVMGQHVPPISPFITPT